MSDGSAPAAPDPVATSDDRESGVGVSAAGVSGGGVSGGGARPGGDRREVAAAVVAVAGGGGLALLATARTWSTVTVTRSAPLGALSVNVTGRTLEPAVTGLAVVALAGVLAVLATRAALRRVIGVVLVLAGVGVLWRAGFGLSRVSDARARQLVSDSRTGVALGAVRSVGVTVHPAWIALAIAGGVLVLAGGALTALRGGQWRAMSSRYESPVGAVRPSSGPSGAAVDHDPAAAVLPIATSRVAGDQPGTRPAAIGAAPSATVPTGPDRDPATLEVARARADLALWHQLDRGEDPTAGDEATGDSGP